MLDKFSVWRWAENRNCWDFVREYLSEKKGVPESDIPKYGILSTDKRAMTKAYKQVVPCFFESNRVDGAIACQYRGRLITHVGVVVHDKVYHVREGHYSKKEDGADFEKTGLTRYFLHKSLWQH